MTPRLGRDRPEAHLARSRNVVLYRAKMRFRPVTCAFADPGDADSVGLRRSGDVAVDCLDTPPDSGHGTRCRAAQPRVQGCGTVVAAASERGVAPSTLPSLLRAPAGRVWLAALSGSRPPGSEYRPASSTAAVYMRMSTRPSPSVRRGGPATSPAFRAPGRSPKLKLNGIGATVALVTCAKRCRTGSGVQASLSAVSSRRVPKVLHML